MGLEEAARLSLKTLRVNSEGALFLSQGKPLGPEHISEADPDLPIGGDSAPIAAFFEDCLLALVEQRARDQFWVKRGIHSPKNRPSDLQEAEPER
jgi:hypothetical protein